MLIPESITGGVLLLWFILTGASLVFLSYLRSGDQHPRHVGDETRMGIDRAVRRTDWTLCISPLLPAAHAGDSRPVHSFTLEAVGRVAHALCGRRRDGSHTRRYCHISSGVSERRRPHHRVPDGFRDGTPRISGAVYEIHDGKRLFHGDQKDVFRRNGLDEFCHGGNDSCYGNHEDEDTGRR